MIFKRNSIGMTLIEIIITISIFSVILIAIFSALATARTSWKSGESQISAQQEARKGLNKMIRELRQARVSTITGVPADGNNYSSITFQMPTAISISGTTWSSNIQYLIGGLNSSQLLRAKDGTQTVLANNISTVSFSRNTSTPDMIRISVTVQKNTFPGLSIIQSDISLSSEVKLRND